MKKILEKLEAFLFPPVCLLCAAQRVVARDNFCFNCWQKARFITKPYCAKTGVPFSFEWEAGTISRRARMEPPLYDFARAALRYEGEFARPLILALKYGDRSELALYLARWLARAGNDILPPCDFIVPVPLHWRRLLSRRFNQAAEFVRALCALTDKPSGIGLLKRVRQTPPQIGLGHKERHLNMRNAFVVPKGKAHLVRGKHIVLVDDVLTSGATMKACTEALRKAGAVRVDVLVLARVVHEVETLV